MAALVQAHKPSRAYFFRIPALFTILSTYGQLYNRVQQIRFSPTPYGYIFGFGLIVRPAFFEIALWRAGHSSGNRCNPVDCEAFRDYTAPSIDQS